MKPKLAEIFNTAIETGEILTIKYHGGSSPGAVRELTPIKITSDRVRARCHTSKAVKVFMFDKIELVEKTVDNFQTNDMWDGRPTKESDTVVTPSNASEICPDHMEKLHLVGWKTKAQDHDSDHFALSLHRPKKTGSGWLKAESASLSFERYSWDLGVTETGDLEKFNVRVRPRPWIVRGNGTTVSYGSYNKAVNEFLSRVSNNTF